LVLIDLWSIFMKQKFSVAEDTTGDKVHKIMVENCPTSGLQRTEQIGMYFWNRIWLMRPCTLSEIEHIVKVVKDLEDQLWGVGETCCK